MKRFASVLCLVALANAGCGVDLYQPRTLVELDPSYEIDDKDIAKAFDAKPQMPAAVNVAFYSATPPMPRQLGQNVEEPRAGLNNDASLEAMLHALPGVGDVYRIPSLLVTDAAGRNEPAYRAEPKPVSIKKLRLAAARAHADVLVIFDHGRVEGSLNPLVALAPLLIPILFVPMTDTRVESYLSAYVIDVRNGYFYGQVDASRAGGAEYELIYNAGEQLDVAKEQWATLTNDVQTKLTELFELERGARLPTARLAH